MKSTPAAVNAIELEIAIDAPRSKVWKALIEEINQWWLADFRVAGPDSKVSFDPTPGGKGLIEITPDGGGLQWFATQMYMPADFKIYVVGNVAPEWGGPTTSNLKLSLVETESGCKLQIHEARHGNVDEKQAQCAADGWKQLFTDGLKAFVEKQQA